MLSAQTDQQSRIAWFEHVLTCAFHSDQIMHYLHDRLEPQHVENPLVGGMTVHRLVYTEMYNHWRDYQDRPSKDLLLCQLKETLRAIANQGFGTTSVDQLAVQVFNLVRSLSRPFDVEQSMKKVVDIINYYYEYIISRPRIQLAMKDAMDESKLDAGDLTEQILTSTALLGGTRAPANAFGFEQISDPSIIPANISWLNNLLGGGFRRGLGYGVLAPTGGGKTTFGGQIAFSIANMGMPAAIVYTEQSMQEPEMKARYWSLVTGEPYDRYLAMVRKGELPGDDLLDEQQRETMKVVNNNLQIYDFSVKRGSMDELKSIALGHMGKKKPEILLVDWAGQFAKQLLTTDPRLKGEKITQALIYVADNIAEIARTAMIPVVVFHQLAPGICKSPMKRYTHMDGDFCKGFCHNLAYGIVIPPRDENHITRVDVSKGRYSTITSQIVKLEGAKGRFTALHDYRMGRYKYEPNSRKDDEMPDVRRRGPTPGGFTMDFEQGK